MRLDCACNVLAFLCSGLLPADGDEARGPADWAVQVGAGGDSGDLVAEGDQRRHKAEDHFKRWRVLQGTSQELGG